MPKICTGWIKFLNAKTTMEEFILVKYNISLPDTYILKNNNKL